MKKFGWGIRNIRKYLKLEKIKDKFKKLLKLFDLEMNGLIKERKMISLIV